MYSRSKGMLGKLLLARRICTTAQMQQQPSLIKLKKNQAKFQCDDGKPVFLKGGFVDKICYCTTWVGCLVGLGMVFELLYQLIKPPSWRKPAEEECD